MRKTQVQISVNPIDANDYYELVKDYKEKGKLPACLFNEMLKAYKEIHSGMTEDLM